MVEMKNTSRVRYTIEGRLCLTPQKKGTLKANNNPGHREESKVLKERVWKSGSGNGGLFFFTWGAFRRIM